MNVRKTLSVSEQIKTEVLALTQPDSILIVDRSDKIFFPDRKVIQPLRSERTYLLMPKIAKETNLYYYGITFPQSDLDFLNNVQLLDDLKIKKIKTFSKESLYEIYHP